MNAKAKGTRNECRSRVLLEAAGYAVTRAAASLGAWDLIGVGSTDVVLVQVKTRDWPGSVEMETISAFRWTADPVVWRKLDRLGVIIREETRAQRTGEVTGRFYGPIPFESFRFGLKRARTAA